MGLQVNSNEGSSSNSAPVQREIAKKGPRVAIISGIIDLGMQPQEYQGEKQRDCREFLPILTLVSDKYTDDEGEQHCMVTSPWPVKIKLGDKSNYTKFCKAADPNGEVLKDGVGDLTQLIGRKVFATMIHNTGKGDYAGINYANCTGIAELPEDYPVADTPINAIVFDTNAPDKDVFEKLWDRTQTLITGSVGYAGSALERALTDGATPEPAKKADAPAAGTENFDDSDIPF